MATPSDREPKVARNLIGGASALLGGRLIGSGLSWAGTALIIRTLSKTQYGSFSFIFNLLGLLGLMADFETTRVVMTEIGRSSADELAKLAGRFLVFRVVLGLVTYALAMVVIAIGPYNRTEVQGVAIGGLSLIIASALWSLISICQAKQWLRLVAAALLVGQVAQFVAVFALYQSHSGSMLRYIVPFVGSDAVSFVVIAIALRGSVNLRLRVDVASWRRWIVAAAPLALGSALGTLYFRIDSIMLTLLLGGDRGRVAVGTYQVGYKFSDLLAFVAPSLIAATLPVLARAWPLDPITFQTTFRQAALLVSIVGAFVAVVFAVFAQPVIVMLAESRYRSAAVSARWLVLAQALNFLTQLVYICLVSANRRRIYPVVTFCGLMINVGLNLVLIPRHGVLGAASATIVTEVVVLILLISNVIDMPLRPLPLRGIGIAVVGACGAGALGAGVSYLTAWPFGVVASAAFYVAALHLGNVDGPGGLPTLWRRSHFGSI